MPAVSSITPPLSDLRFPALVPVKRQGEILYWAKEATARRLIAKGLVQAMATAQRVRALVVIERRHDSAADCSGRRNERPTQFAGQRYSHCHAVPELYLDEHGVEHRTHPLNANPQGVWTLKRISRVDAPVFRAVVATCLSR